VSEAARTAGTPLRSVRDLVISVPGSYDATADQVRYADRISTDRVRHRRRDRRRLGTTSRSSSTTT
jgi:hypothetical protein